MKKKPDISQYDTWELLNTSKKTPVEISAVKQILLENRNVSDEQEFFDPPIPFDLSLKDLQIDRKQIEKAVKRVKKATDNKQKVIVYGDYDADGITATAILWEALYRLGIDIIPHIPSRFEEGYGLNYESFIKLKDENPDLSLIITVDNGIVAVDACKKIKKDGVDVIITDHHQKRDKLPDVGSVVHTTKITGAAIAWIFAREVYDRLGGDKQLLQKSLDLAAIGTIADIAPLVGANRSFAFHGLKELNKLERRGLAELADVSGVSPGQIAAYTVGFILAPRLNAMGRLDDAMESLRLLCSSNRRRVRLLASKLTSVNQKRQKVLEDVVEKALDKIGEADRLSSIVISDRSYHEGVIGLAASRLVEEYYLPSIVLSEGKEFSKASARSISGFNIIESIRKLGHLIEDGGGHPMAAGFTIKTENIEGFAQEFEKIAKKQLSEELKKKKLSIDMRLDVKTLSLDLAKMIDKFQPVGPANPTPTFLTEKLQIKSMRTVGKTGDHLKMILAKDKKFVDAIAFGSGKLGDTLETGDLVDVVYSPDVNRWSNSVTLQLKIKDIRYHE